MNARMMKLIEDIQNAVKGEEVRSAIIESLIIFNEKINRTIALLVIQGLAIIALSIKLILVTR